MMSSSSASAGRLRNVQLFRPARKAFHAESVVVYSRGLRRRRTPGRAGPKAPHAEGVILIFAVPVDPVIPAECADAPRHPRTRTQRSGTRTRFSYSIELSFVRGEHSSVERGESRRVPNGFKSRKLRVALNVFCSLAIHPAALPPRCRVGVGCDHQVIHSGCADAPTSPAAHQHQHEVRWPWVSVRRRG
jgi:hypothetical protein